MGPLVGDASSGRTGSDTDRAVENVELPVRVLGLQLLTMLVIIVVAVVVDASGMLGG